MSGLKASRWGPTLLLWHKLGMHRHWLRQSSGSEVLQERALAANATPHIAQTSRPESEVECCLGMTTQTALQVCRSLVHVSLKGGQGSNLV